MKIFQQKFDYDYPWSHTTLSLFRKYPNPYASHVLTVDTLSRSIDPTTGVVRTERLLGCKQSVPKWIMRILGVTEDAFVREVIFVDPVNQLTTMVSVNLSLSQYVQCLELISYTPVIPDTNPSPPIAPPTTSPFLSLLSSPTPREPTPLFPPDLSKSTTFFQKALISSPPAPPPSLPFYRESGSLSTDPPSKAVQRVLRSVGQKLEDSGVERFGMNAESGRRGFDFILKGLWERDGSVIDYGVEQ